MNASGASSSQISSDPVNDAAIGSNTPYDALVYDRLFRFTVDGTNVVPQLATGYKFDSTGTQFTASSPISSSQF